MLKKEAKREGDLAKVIADKFMEKKDINGVQQQLEEIQIGKLFS